MNIKNWKNSLAPVITLVAFGVASAQTDATQTFDIPLSAPGQPASLSIDLIQGSVTVIGENRADMQLTVEPSGKRRQIITPSGSRSLPGVSFELDVNERDNAVSVNPGWNKSGMNIRVRVPVDTSLDIGLVNKGDMVISNVRGEHTLRNVNGRIDADAIRGSVVAETVNKDIVVAFDEIDPTAPMSFNSLNGDLDVSFPDNLAATFVISGQSDDIYSDFEVDVRPSEPAMRRQEGDGSFRIELTQEIIAEVAGGGPTIRMKTMQGGVSIRRN